MVHLKTNIQLKSDWLIPIKKIFQNHFLKIRFVREGRTPADIHVSVSTFVLLLNICRTWLHAGSQLTKWTFLVHAVHKVWMADWLAGHTWRLKKYQLIEIPTKQMVVLKTCLIGRVRCSSLKMFGVLLVPIAFFQFETSLRRIL